MRRFEDGGFKIPEFFSFVNPRGFVTAEVAEVEEFALSGGGSVHKELREIAKSYVTVKNDDGDWDLEAIITAEEIEASRLRSKMRALQDKCRSKSVQILADMSAVIALAKRCLCLERQATNRKQVLREMERKCQVANSTAISA